MSNSNPTETIYLTTAAGYRDFGAWMHIVVAVDTTQGVEQDRAKFYVNGERVSDFVNSTYPEQNAELILNKVNEQLIGVDKWNSAIADTYYGGYLSEVHFIDDFASYAPTSMIRVTMPNAILNCSAQL